MVIPKLPATAKLSQAYLPEHEQRSPDTLQACTCTTSNCSAAASVCSCHIAVSCCDGELAEAGANFEGPGLLVSGECISAWSVWKQALMALQNPG